MPHTAHGSHFLRKRDRVRTREPAATPELRPSWNEQMIDARKSNATLHPMDYIARLELEAALKYAEAEHGYSYATVSEGLPVSELYVDVMAELA